jgi:hypothetical protein
MKHSTLLAVTLTILSLLSPTESVAQKCGDSSVVVIPHYNPQDYLGKYRLVGATDTQVQTVKVVTIVLKRTDDTTKPVVAFNEESPGVTAAAINAAKGVKVSLGKDGKHLIVEFLNKDGSPYFRSTLLPNDE